MSLVPVSSADFGPARRGGGQSIRVFTLTNNAAVSLTNVAISYTAPGASTDYSTLFSTCGATLNAGQSCFVNVRFAPKNSDIAGSTQSRTPTVNGRLGGVGLAPPANIAPAGVGPWPPRAGPTPELAPDDGSAAESYATMSVTHSPVSRHGDAGGPLRPLAPPAWQRTRQAPRPSCWVTRLSDGSQTVTFPHDWSTERAGSSVQHVGPNRR